MVQNTFSVTLGQLKKTNFRQIQVTIRCAELLWSPGFAGCDMEAFCCQALPGLVLSFKTDDSRRGECKRYTVLSGLERTLTGISI